MSFDVTHSRVVDISANILRQVMGELKTMQFPFSVQLNGNHLSLSVQSANGFHLLYLCLCHERRIHIFWDTFRNHKGHLRIWSSERFLYHQKEKTCTLCIDSTCNSWQHIFFIWEGSFLGHRDHCFLHHSELALKSYGQFILLHRLDTRQRFTFCSSALVLYTCEVIHHYYTRTHRVS